MENSKILILEDNKLDFINIHNVLNKYIDNVAINPNIPENDDQTWEDFIDKIQNFSTNGFKGIFQEKELLNVNLFIIDISLLGGNDDKIGLEFVKVLEAEIPKDQNIDYILVSKGSKLTGFNSKWYPDFFSTNFVDKEYEGKYFGEKLVKKITKLWNLET